MKVQGHEITDAQIAAGCGVMKAVFDGYKVRAALLKAGVPNNIAHAPFNPALEWFAWEVANRLLQRERKAGRIVHLGGGKWERRP